MSFKLYLFIFISLFSFSFPQNKDIEIKVMSVKDCYKEINNNYQLDNETYTKISQYLATYLYNYYYYYFFTNIKGFTNYMINLYSRINKTSSNNANYIDFFNAVTKTIFYGRDVTLNIVFKNIKEYNYFIPFEFYFKTEQNKNNLYIRLSENKYFIDSYNESFIQSLKNITNKKIEKINGKDPISYIHRFIQNSFFRDFYQTQVSFNLKIISTHSIFFEFNETVFNNINLTYKDEGKDKTLKYDYKIYKIKKLSSEFGEYYYKEKEKYNNTYYEPSVFEFYERYNIEKKPENNSFWDMNYKNMIKLKLHEKANVIYQNDFNFEGNKAVSFFGEMMEKMSKNNNPIIIILSGTFGGNEYYTSIFEKILNYNISNPRIKVGYRISSYSYKEDYIKRIHYDLKTCSPTYPILNKINQSITNYTNFYNRSDILLLNNTYLDIEKELNKYNYTTRKPTEIVIYTDGLTFGASNIFIENIKNEGKGIIVGYSGNPSLSYNNYINKYEINGSSSSISEDIMKFSDDRIQYLNKYNISLRLPIGAIYDDEEQNKNVNDFTFPSLLKKKNIDERSKIFNYYTDAQFNDFLNEGLEIINKYKNSCNKDNENLVLYHEKCYDFKKDGITHGGYKCDNGTWSEVCVPAYCSEGYYFDTYLKKCFEDKCKKIYSFTYVCLIVSFVVFICLVGFLIFKFFIKGGITLEDIGGGTLLNY